MRYLWQWSLRVVWKLIEGLKIKTFIVDRVSSNTILAKIYSLAVAGIKTDKPITINNYKMYVAQEGCKGGWIGENILIKGSYEPYTTQIFKQVLREGMVAVDVGAHIGYYTLLASSLVGESGQVYAFEPEPQNYKDLQRNVELNGFKNIKAYQKAVFSHAGKLPLYMGIHSGMHSLFKVKDTTEKTVMVDMVSLDDILGRRKVDLVKVDTQGAELDVLIGMRKVIKHNKDLKLIIEFQPNLEHDNSLREYWRELATGFGFIYIIDEGRGNIEIANYNYVFEFCKKKRIEGLNLLCATQPFGKPL